MDSLAPVVSCAIHRSELRQRLDAIRQILDTAHPGGASSNISRDARGLAILLLYAAYENLLTTLCRSLLELVQQLRVGNRRLKPGLRVIAAHARLLSLASVSP